MANITIFLGFSLISMGLISYFATGMQSLTALIPAFFGLPLSIIGFWGKGEKARKNAMHIAVALSFLGLIGTFSGLIKFIKFIGGIQPERPEAVIVQGVMALLCLAYVILGVKSFIDARSKAKN